MIVSGWTDRNGDSITWNTPGVYLHPDGNSWSSNPFTKDQKKVDKEYWKDKKCRDRVIEHLNRTDRGIFTEIKLIKKGVSTLPRYAKNYLLEIAK